MSTPSLCRQNQIPPAPQAAEVIDETARPCVSGGDPHALSLRNGVATTGTRSDQREPSADSHVREERALELSPTRACRRRGVGKGDRAQRVSAIRWAVSDRSGAPTLRANWPQSRDGSSRRADGEGRPASPGVERGYVCLAIELGSRRDFNPLGHLSSTAVTAAVT
jgi:hypothetical protein